MKRLRGKKNKHKKAAQERIRYDSCDLTPADIGKAAITGAGIAFLTAYLAYESWIALVPLSAVPIFCVRKYRIIKTARRKKELNTGFMTFLESLSVYLMAGYSTENAVNAVGKDLQKMYGKDSVIVKELFYMSSQLQVSVTPEELFSDLAVRSGLVDIENFSAVYSAAKRSGGDLGRIVKHTYRIMREKNETEKEIEAVLAARKAEQRLMSIMPIGIILYLKLTSPGFLSSMYDSPAGNVVMSLCLAVYVLALYLGKRIVEIHL